MTGMDHPPSTTSSPRVARRALTTSVAALLAVVAPVGLVTTTAGGTNTPTTGVTSSSIVPERLDAIRAQHATEAEVATIVVPVPTTVAPPTTAAPPPPAPAPPAPAPPAPAPPVATGGGYNDPNNPAAWDRLAQCESGGNWATNTGNGYYGGIQFSLGSWQSVGGSGRPDQASRDTQIAMGQRLYNAGGWQHWPACTSALGYR